MSSVLGVILRNILKMVAEGLDKNKDYVILWWEVGESGIYPLDK